MSDSSMLLREDPAAADPLMGMDDLLTLLVPAVRAGRLVDAYLLAAGALQLAEDAAEGTAWSVRRLQGHLESTARATPVRAAVTASAGGLDAWTEAALRGPVRRGLRRWTAELADLTESLADLVVQARETGAREAGPAPSAAVTAAAERLYPALRRMPGARRLLAEAVIRQPSCFRSFDLHPADVVELVRRFAERHTRRERPLLVVGVRTSGSYLAPLAASALRRLGYGAVTAGTSRPGGALLPGRGAAVRAVARGGGAVLLLDDPPVTGGAVGAVARRAARAGFPPEAVIPLLPVFGDAEPGEERALIPGPLRAYPCVVLPGSEWHVRARLRGPALEAAVAAVLAPGERLLGVRAGAQGPLIRWRHLSVPVDARVADAHGAERTLRLVAEWAGVGHFGRHTAELARALDGFVPTVLGFQDGLLLRERLPGEDPEAEAGAPVAVPPEVVTEYLVTRQKRLAVPADRSGRLAGRQPVWEVAARVLAPAFGRLAPLARPLLLDPVARALLAAPEPSLTDGRPDPALWAADGAGRWAKLRWAEGSFSNLDLAGYDPLHDLAGAALHTPDGGAALLAVYRERTGAEVPAARWCLLTLVHGWNAVRLAASGALPPEAAQRARQAQARAVQRFLSEVYGLAELPEPTGPWCVLDVDGVLETDVLGFPAGSPRGALALRALRAHGYRTLLATGRSAPEVADRCAAYGLVGGAGEYGAVTVVAGAAQAEAEPYAETEAGRALAARLAALPGVELDPRFRGCVRAFRRPSGGLPAETVAEVLRDPAVRGRFTAVPGDAQTDFLPSGVDKAVGVRALLARLGEPDAVPVLAVGDGEADVGLLRWARAGFAPANVHPALRASGVPVLRRAYQSGLFDAVARLIGHRPGDCPRCRVPEPEPLARFLLGVLAVPEAGRRGAPAALGRLTALRASGFLLPAQARR
jgi:hypothetical protein